MTRQSARVLLRTSSRSSSSVNITTTRDYDGAFNKQSSLSLDLSLSLSTRQCSVRLHLSLARHLPLYVDLVANCDFGLPPPCVRHSVRHPVRPQSHPHQTQAFLS